MQSRTLSERIRTDSNRFLGGFVKIALPEGIGGGGEARLHHRRVFQKV